MAEKRGEQKLIDGLHDFFEERTMLNALKVAGVVLAGVARREAKAGTRLTLKLAIREVD